MTKIVAIQGLQFGSEAKGNIATLVAQQWKPDTVVTAWGPNAGHTAYWDDNKFVHTMLAVGALGPSVQNILIGPGSVLDVNKLADEIKIVAAANKKYLQGKNLIIHPQAPIWAPYFADKEKSLIRIGSTMKGTMEVMYEKMRRDPDGIATARLQAATLPAMLGEAMDQAGMSLAISETHYNRALDQGDKILVEGAQGYSLGIHTGFYPYTTSRDVSTAQLMADCRIPWGIARQVHTIGVFRTYPIRVANRRDSAGGLIGTSGGFYPDQNELDWEVHLEREPELTTVTKLPRRLFNFSYEQICEAYRIMRPQSMALTFCDYRVEKDASPVEVGSEIPTGLRIFLDSCMPAPVQLISFGPRPSDIYRDGHCTVQMPDLGFLP